MVDQAFTVDLSKPLVFQVGHLGEAYQEWVHQPIVSKESPRFFENGLMEFCTRTVWWAIPVIWLPVVFWFVSSSVKSGVPIHHLVASLVFGILIWTLLEYCLHRFLFHSKTKSYWGNTVHYLFHGCHHKHPMDGLRLVFPPPAAAIFAVLLWRVVKFLVRRSCSPVLFGGGLLGYVVYDCTHYFLHHGKPSKGFSHELKDGGFGVTSTFWDRVFGTLPPPNSAKKNS